jgi:hypothetical protein
MSKVKIVKSAPSGGWQDLSSTFKFSNFSASFWPIMCYFILRLLLLNILRKWIFKFQTSFVNAKYLKHFDILYAIKR